MPEQEPKRKHTTDTKTTFGYTQGRKGMTRSVKITAIPRNEPVREETIQGLLDQIHKTQEAKASGSIPLKRKRR